MERPAGNLGPNYRAAMERYADLMEKDCDKKIDWDVLKEDFFRECIQRNKVAMLPSILFEWFKNEINEYLK